MGSLSRVLRKSHCVEASLARHWLFKICLNENITYCTTWHSNRRVGPPGACQMLTARLQAKRGVMHKLGL